MIDFMVTEAVAIKVRKLDDEARAEAQETAKRKEFKQDYSELESFR